jgi:hypothetical protein
VVRRGPDGRGGLGWAVRVAAGAVMAVHVGLSLLGWTRRSGRDRAGRDKAGRGGHVTEWRGGAGIVEAVVSWQCVVWLGLVCRGGLGAVCRGVARLVGVWRGGRDLALKGVAG